MIGSFSPLTRPSIGFLGRFCVSPMASSTIFGALRRAWPPFFFPSSSFVAFAFALCTGFALYFSFNQLGFWVSLVGFFGEACSGFLLNFRKVCWVWVLLRQVLVFVGGFYCFLDCGFHVGAFWVFDGVVLLFLAYEFVRALLYIACVRKGALHFFNKVASYL